MRKKLSLTLSMALIFTLLCGLGFATQNSEKEPVNKEDSQKEITLHVDGMKCQMCNISVNRALKKLDGVIDSKADYKTKSVIVKYDEKKVTTKDMLKAIKDVGFNPTVPSKSE